MNSILEEDIQSIVESKLVLWELFFHQTILITGATGLIGSLLVRTFLYYNQKHHSDIKLLLIVRDRKKAEDMFGQDSIVYFETSLESLEEIPYEFSYVIHCASPTKSKYFVECPVETMNTSILGTQKLLELCRKKNIHKFLYLSSMEMYGVLDDINVTEDKLGYLNGLDVRSSYSMGKRACELYCSSYCYEYQVPVVMARLAMCFGAGVSKEETRVYKYFCDCVLNGTNVEVKSSGKTIVNFIYTKDAIESLLLLLTKGVSGEAYNVCSDGKSFTILDMAHYLVNQHGKNIQVVQNIPKENLGFAPENRMILSNEKLKTLGKKEFCSIEKALDRTLEYLKYEKRN